jgi:Holliday junction resolvasome RuvABC endonuclease subunit
MTTQIGLDCSTTTCGYSINENGVIVSAGFIDLTSLNTTKNKAFYILNVIDPLIKQFNVGVINLEAAMSGFRGGKTSQQTIIKLVRMNCILEYVLIEKYKDTKINLVNVLSARKQLFGKAFVKGIPAKKYVQIELDKLMGSLIYKFFVFTKKGKLDKRNEDLLDSIVLSLFNS